MLWVVMIYKRVEGVFIDAYMVTYEKRNMKDFDIFKEMEWNPWTRATKAV
ncbi:hypothetical protein DsansV1_C03g0026021 [Dioscorea sansibarensis]